MRIAMLLSLMVLNGCLHMAEGQAKCDAQFGPEWKYNGLSKTCINWSQPIVPLGLMMPLMLNQPEPGPPVRYTAPQITVPPMNRCNSLVIGNQIQTTCY